jgi:AcrR family transcriptional regulator
MTISTFDARQQAILSAAVEIIAGAGQDAVSMAALAEKTGLSRPAIYQYFASREHVLGELLINEMADLSNELDRLVADVSDPLERIRIWMHYSLAHLSSAQHRSVREISIENLPEDQRGMLRAMHGYFMMSLITPLNELGVEDSSALCGLIYGSVATAAKRIDAGSEFTVEARALEKFAMAGVEAALEAAPETSTNS